MKLLKNKKSFIALFLIFIILSGCQRATISSPTEENLIKTSDILFFDFHNKLSTRTPDLFSNHKLLNGVIFAVPWSQIEPERNKFDFSLIDKKIDLWNKAGKKVVLKIVPYYDTRGNDATPHWIYENVPSIKFSSTKNDNFVIPKVWDAEFIKEYKNFIIALAQHYNNNNKVDFIQIGIGHLGFLTAQPSKQGSEAFLGSGWSTLIWEKYAKDVIDIYSENFNSKKLILTVTPLFLRNYLLKDNLETAFHILDYAVERKFNVLFKGVDPDTTSFQDMVFLDVVKHLASLNLEGISLGFGDDWPLYGQTGSKFRDESDFKTSLDNIYNLWVSIDKKYPFYLVLLDDELASTQKGNDKFNLKNYNSLVDFLNKLQN